MFETIVLLLFLNLNSMALPLEDQCSIAHGELRGRGCYCSFLGIYIDPFKDYCFPVKLNQALNEVQTLTGKKCQWDPNNQIKIKDSLISKDRTEFCSDPSKILCDERYNPLMIKTKEAETNFDLLKRKIEGTQKIKNYIASQSAGELQRCSQLKLDAWRKCQSLIEDQLEKELYSPQRKQRAREIFLQARSSIVAVLKEKKKQIEQSGPSESLPTINQMIESVEETEIHFGPFIEKDPTTFNVSLKAMIPSKAQKWAESDLDQNYRNTLYLEGMILYADEAPEALLAAFVGELAHIVGPGSSRFSINKASPRNPFLTELNCLKSKVSINAQPGDANCYQKLAQKYKSIDPRKAESLNATAQNINRNPEMAWSSPILDTTEKCQMGQTDEAFTDWLATEAFALQDINSPEGLNKEKASINKSLILLQEQLVSSKRILGFIARRCNNLPIEKNEDLKGDSRLKALDQLNSILLNHPKIRTTIGCEPTQRPTVPTANNQESPKPSYCGHQLNPPTGLNK
ncbi:MAG: hypothetical protein RJB66_1214 [Pseudomonadota bacterium]|jgi:hypothetical protein